MIRNYPLIEYRRFQRTYTYEQWQDPLFRNDMIAEAREQARQNAPAEVTIWVKEGRRKGYKVVTIKAH